ncbi:Sec-independent protein translocase protein TatCy [Austwickia sp. TVS 96-490-7B]|nr:Sec-independent protein translocase protein TatCy [Austwickia sp. TVS 96-490-7B]
MSLIEHLIELRNRVVVAAVAIAVGVIPGWMLYEPMFALLVRPLKDRGGHVNYAGLTDPFAVHLQMALSLAIILTAPVWVWQIWAFIVPGLTRREKRTAMAFIGVAVPLFLGGCALALWTLPMAVDVLVSFTPAAGDNIIGAPEYFTFLTRYILAFGFAFLMPVFLVALNVIGILPARVMLSGWRWAVIGNFVFAAMMTPTPDPWTMFILALPMCALFYGAYGVAWLLDRRRDRRRPSWTRDVPDDQASSL